MPLLEKMATKIRFFMMMFELLFMLRLKKQGLKEPDIAEIALSGDLTIKLNFIKEI